MPASSTILRLGTRGSQLARMQSQLVADALEKANPGMHVELVIVKTSGDAITDRPLHELGGKGLFVKELELALLNKEIDFAVHSFKDLPVTMPLVDESELVIAAVPRREDPRDVLIVREGLEADAIAKLPSGATIATGSLRRRCQILCLRPDLQVQPIRGNIDTRLLKLREGQGNLDAIVLAMAGIRRVGLFDSQCMHALEIAELLPAAGQGALALQCRTDAGETRQVLTTMHDAQTARGVAIERDVVRRLDGDCHSPIAAYAEIIHEQSIHLHAAVGAHDGQPPVIAAFSYGKDGDDHLAQECCDKLIAQGANMLLHGSNTLA